MLEKINKTRRIIPSVIMGCNIPVFATELINNWIDIGVATVRRLITKEYSAATYKKSLFENRIFFNIENRLMSSRLFEKGL